MAWPFTGCALKSLEMQLTELERLATLEGDVVNEPSDSPVVVLLFGEELSQESLVKYWIVRGSGRFHFYLRPDVQYHLAAFEDANSDYRYQPGERLIYHGSPSPVKPAPGETSRTSS
jgi:hypothetical protein